MTQWLGGNTDSVLHHLSNLSWILESMLSHFRPLIDNSERLYKPLTPFTGLHCVTFSFTGINLRELLRYAKNCKEIVWVGLFCHKVIKCLCFWVLKWLNLFKRLIWVFNYMKSRYHQVLLLHSDSVIEQGKDNPNFRKVPKPRDFLLLFEVGPSPI